MGIVKQRQTYGRPAGPQHLLPELAQGRRLHKNGAGALDTGGTRASGHKDAVSF